MEFNLGCNYWASNAGAEMWSNFSEEAIKKDLKALSENGVKYIRVFPNWRDFQPVEPLITGSGALSRYTIKGQILPDNPYYLSTEMLDKFSLFLDICEKYGIKLIVGLITGWMSGGLFVPAPLYGENVIKSPLAQYFEQLFIKGFVERFKDRSCIYAWDLGNECNCMATTSSRWEVTSWIAMISNAIRASDPTRPVISGMHGLVVSGKWTLGDQGLFTDMLTTHPYPFWGEFTRIDETLALRTTMYPTVQSKFYANIGGKPCLAEEIGTMGPMVCSDENAASFMRLNLFSLWANGATGAMWWCAHEQTGLESFPYSDQMVERELGMLDANHTPKPVLKEIKKFSSWLDGLDFELPLAKDDAVCLLTRDQKHWGVGYMTYILARKAGINCSFAYIDDALPDSSLYIMPSICAYQVMTKGRYEQLKKKVYDGADLYISIENAILSDFENLSGLKVLDSYECNESGTIRIDGHEIAYSRPRTIIAQPTTAEVLVYDDKNRPFISVNKYGQGRVFFVNAPIESNLINKRNAFDGNTHLIYSSLFADHADNYPASVSDKELMVTYHPTDDGAFINVINHCGEDKKFTLKLKDGYKTDKVYYGSTDSVGAYDACVIKIIKE